MNDSNFINSDILHDIYRDEGTASIIDYLLTKNMVSINSKDRRGNTILLYMVEHDDANQVEYILTSYFLAQN